MNEQEMSEITESVEDTNKKLPNRQSPFSEAFIAFIPQDWDDYDPNLPQPLPAAAHTPARRDRVAETFSGDILVLPAGQLRPRNNDCDYPFRPHSAFAHLSGLGEDREPDAVLVIDATGDTAETTLFFKPRAPRTDPEFYSDARYGEMWVGKRESLEEMAALIGFATRPIDELHDVLAAEPARLRILREADPSWTATIDELRNSCESVAYGEDDDATLEVFVSELRLVKDEFEVSQLQEACDKTAIGFAAVVSQFPAAVAKGRGERWIEGVFDLHARHLGNEVGYGSICAAGDHANTLHWVRNDGDLRDGELILIDAGVEVNSLYTADITRTLPINGTFTEAQRKVYDAVLEAQEAGMAAAKPGATFHDVHDAAIAVVARKLEEWGILPVSAEESLSADGGQHRRWMVHGTSHHLGLDVHDCARARQENYRDGVLEPGMVITVEPGIYFKETDQLVPDELRGIGVRIEDDIVITEDGCRILSDKLPRTAEAVERWMAEVWEGKDCFGG